jgi:hypothetical protein
MCARSKPAAHKHAGGLRRQSRNAFKRASFIASKIRAQFEPQLLECASACVPAIKQVKVVCQKEKAA